MATAAKADTGPHVYTAIAAVQGELAHTGISKSRRNQQQNYSFRGIDDVYAALSPLLAKHGLCVIPRCLDRECVEGQTRKGDPLFRVTVKAEFDFVSSSDGSKHTAATFGEAMDSADKATNKAMSAAYKYAAFMTFAIPTEGDNDADAVTPEVAARPSVGAPANANDEPAPRTKLEGVHTSKTALRRAVCDIISKVRSAQSEEELKAIQKEHIETIKQANKAWPALLTGDPNIPEDVGLKGAIEERRAQLASDDGMYSMLIASMKEIDNLHSLANWRSANDPLIAELDGKQGRDFEMAFNLFESGLMEVARVNAG